MSNDVLIVVDLQNGFVNARSEHVVDPIVRFTEEWIASGKPAVFTRFLNPEGSKWESLIHWTRLRTSPEIDLVDPLQKVATATADNAPLLVADKLSYSSLTDEVRAFIQEHDVTNVYVCGIATDGCVMKTAVDVFETSALVPFVLTDLVASHAGEEIHQAGLLLTGRYIGKDQLIESRAI